MPRQDDTIEFEDLHGQPDLDRALEVDLDADQKSTGITRQRPRLREAEDEDDRDDPFDDLPSSRERDDRPDGRRERLAGNTFEARLKREQDARKREKDRADAAERRLADELSSRKVTRKQDSDKARTDLDAAIAETETQLEAALEAEDTKRQVKLTSQLTDQKARRIALEYTTPDEEEEPERTTTPAKNEHLDAWVSSHDDWYKRPGFERQTRLAYRLDKEVFNDGYDTHTPEYFEELDRRIREKAPELFDDKPDDDDDAGRSRRGRRTQPVAGTERDVDGRATPRRTSNKVQLDRADFANMRSFGLNPDDPEVLKEYARNKRQTAAAEDTGR